MAFSKSVIRSCQAPAKCGICETDQPIKWKCIDCDNLLCNHCKDKVHPKLKDTENHQVVNIKDVGQPTVVELNINKQYQTELPRITRMSHCHDDSLWISSLTDKVLQRVKPEGTKLKILSSFNIEFYDMAVTQSNNLLLSTGESSLKQISNAGILTYDSVYNMSPFFSRAVHITSDSKVLVGGVYRVRRVVMLMNQNGDQERVYEHDKHKQPIFSLPLSITSTSNRNIYVVDRSSDNIDRVVVLGQDGDIINIYTGDTKINKDRPFKPRDIVTTPKDNVIIADIGTHTLHILNNAGLLMTYYKTSDINIRFPWSLTFTSTGQLYIGCMTPKISTIKDAKIYELNEVTISGC